ncbi:diguanylate cyclase, partial [Mesorhizobium sp. M3A.F.Ca.ET.201.01.1.1]
VDRFIARANIAHFEDLLARETDPEKRRVIEALLARERQRLDIAERQADVVQKPVAPTRTYEPSA